MSKFKIEKVGDTELPPMPGKHDYDPIRVHDLPKTTQSVDSHVIYTLNDLRNDGLTFFHPGMLYNVGYDPVRACWAENGWDLKDAPFMVPLPSQVFLGASDPLDRVIFACVPDKINELLKFMDRMRLDGVSIPLCKDTRWDSVRQVTAIKDPIVGSIDIKSHPSKMIPIHIYGLEGTTESMLWAPVKKPGLVKQLQITRYSPKVTAMSQKSLDFSI